MKADNKEAFLYMWNDKLFNFNENILGPWLEEEFVGLEFVSMSLLSVIILESLPVILSKLHVIREYVILLIYCLIIKTLSLIVLW